MSRIEIPFIKIEQHNYKFYVCNLDARTLNSICSTSMKNFQGGNEVYQRELDLSRVRKIGIFSKRDKGLMPTSIVLNSKSRLEFIPNEDKLVIDTERKDSFFIIDGQHRIAGAGESSPDYQFCVVIFDNVDEDLQSELFVSINNEQKRVNPNVRFNIRANDSVKTPEKVYQKIAVVLNERQDSPFYGLLRMGEHSIKGTTLSVSAFASGFLGYTYDGDDYYELKSLLEKKSCLDAIRGNLSDYNINEGKYFLWKFYSNDREDILYKIICNYFNAIRDVFPDEWGSNKKNSILSKTTGFNAFMILFKDVYRCCEKNNHDFSYKYIYGIICRLRPLSGMFTNSNWGLGKVGAMQLYKKMAEIMSQQVLFDYDSLEQMSDAD